MERVRTASARRRFAVGAFAMFAVVAVCVALWAWLRGGALIQHGVERIASQVTDTPVRVERVDVAAVHRSAELAGLSVANPRGFEPEPALRFSDVSFQVRDAVGRGPIVLEALRVGAPVVQVEIQKHARVNILVLRDQIRASARAGRPGPPPAELGDVLADRASRAHVRVERLEIAPARVVVDASEYGPDEPIELTLAPVELTNVGGAAGLTPAELTRTITLAVLESTIEAVAKAHVEGTREGIPGVLDRIRRTGRHLLDGEL